eukprot:tig00001208_g7519.t1
MSQAGRVFRQLRPAHPAAGDPWPESPAASPPPRSAAAEPAPTTLSPPPAVPLPPPLLATCPFAIAHGRFPRETGRPDFVPRSPSSEYDFILYSYKRYRLALADGAPPEADSWIGVPLRLLLLFADTGQPVPDNMLLYPPKAGRLGIKADARGAGAVLHAGRYSDDRFGFANSSHSYNRRPTALLIADAASGTPLCYVRIFVASSRKGVASALEPAPGPKRARRGSWASPSSASPSESDGEADSDSDAPAPARAARAPAKHAAGAWGEGPAGDALVDAFSRLNPFVAGDPAEERPGPDPSARPALPHPARPFARAPSLTPGQRAQRPVAGRQPRAGCGPGRGGAPGLGPAEPPGPGDVKAEADSWIESIASAVAKLAAPQLAPEIPHPRAAAAEGAKPPARHASRQLQAPYRHASDAAREAALSLVAAADAAVRSTAAAAGVRHPVSFEQTIPRRVAAACEDLATALTTPDLFDTSLFLSREGRFRARRLLEDLRLCGSSRLLDGVTAAWMTWLGASPPRAIKWGIVLESMYTFVMVGSEPIGLPHELSRRPRAPRPRPGEDAQLMAEHCWNALHVLCGHAFHVTLDLLPVDRPFILNLLHHANALTAPFWAASPLLHARAKQKAGYALAAVGDNEGALDAYFEAWSLLIRSGNTPSRTEAELLVELAHHALTMPAKWDLASHLASKLYWFRPAETGSGAEQEQHDLHVEAVVMRTLGQEAFMRRRMKEAKRYYLRSAEILEGLAPCYRVLVERVYQLLHHIAFRSADFRSIIRVRSALTGLWDGSRPSCREKATKTMRWYLRFTNFVYQNSPFRPCLIGHVCYHLGSTYMMCGEWAKALRFFERAQAGAYLRFPAYFPPHNARARATVEAIAVCRGHLSSLCLSPPDAASPGSQLEDIDGEEGSGFPRVGAKRPSSALSPPLLYGLPTAPSSLSPTGLSPPGLSPPGPSGSPPSGSGVHKPAACTPVEPSPAPSASMPAPPPRSPSALRQVHDNPLRGVGPSDAHALPASCAPASAPVPVPPQQFPDFDTAFWGDAS